MGKLKRFIVKNWMLLLIIASGLLVRLSFYNSIDGIITTSDSSTYIGAAKLLFSNMKLDEYRPPVYPLVLMLSGILLKWQNLEKTIILLQIIFGVINIVFAYKLALEVFDRRGTAYFAAFITAVNFRIYTWDFMMLTENLSILLVTLITYYLVKFLKFGNLKHIRTLFLLILISVFTKPFFLALPFAAAVIILFDIFVFKEVKLKPIALKLAAGISIIAVSLVAYSMVNYMENGFFGLSSVGNVNSFGKILQYNMESLGSNQKLKSDIVTAFKNESPEFIVDGKYLEPWHFIGTYGWNKNHYSEIAGFSRQILFSYPAKYVYESIKLTFNLLILNSPFTDFIAELAVLKANHPGFLMSLIKKATDIFGYFYLLQLVFFMEVLTGLFLKGKSNKKKQVMLYSTLLIIVLYHYAVSAFLSYGDYSRLLAPCYTIINIIMCRYIFMFISAIFSIGKSLTTVRKV